MKENSLDKRLNTKEIKGGKSPKWAFTGTLAKENEPF